jgi:hypothetical protein
VRIEVTNVSALEIGVLAVNGIHLTQGLSSGWVGSGAGGGGGAYFDPHASPATVFFAPVAVEYSVHPASDDRKL